MNNLELVRWWHSLITLLVDIFYVILRVIHHVHGSCKPQKDKKIWILKKQELATKFTIRALILLLINLLSIQHFLGLGCYKSGAEFIWWVIVVLRFRGVRPSILWLRWSIFTCLYIENSVFKIGVHEFWDLRHILEQKLCRSGGQPSHLIVNHPIHVWILVFMLA